MVPSRRGRLTERRVYQCGRWLRLRDDVAAVAVRRGLVTADPSPRDRLSDVTAFVSEAEVRAAGKAMGVAYPPPLPHLAATARRPASGGGVCASVTRSHFLARDSGGPDLSPRRPTRA